MFIIPLSKLTSSANYGIDFLTSLVGSANLKIKYLIFYS